MNYSVYTWTVPTVLFGRCLITWWWESKALPTSAVIISSEKGTTFSRVRVHCSLHAVVTCIHRVTDVSRTITFPDRRFPDKTFPGQDISRTRPFPDKTIPRQRILFHARLGYVIKMFHSCFTVGETSYLSNVGLFRFKLTEMSTSFMTHSQWYPLCSNRWSAELKSVSFKRVRFAWKKVSVATILSAFQFLACFPLVVTIIQLGRGYVYEMKSSTLK